MGYATGRAGRAGSSRVSGSTRTLNERERVVSATSQRIYLSLRIFDEGFEMMLERYFKARRGSRINLCRNPKKSAAN